MRQDVNLMLTSPISVTLLMYSRAVLGSNACRLTLLLHAFLAHVISELISNLM